MNVHVPYTQAGRMMAVDTPLGPDVLLLEQLRVEEGVNALFTIEAAVKSQRDDLKASDLIGASVDFRLKLADDGTRWWNGFVTHLHEGSLTNRGTRSYALTVRPKLWTLGQKSDCRIFRSTTSVQVVETLCQEHGISDLDVRVTGQPPVLDYSVQWNETDLAYLLRRTQQDGIFFFFEQAQGRHTLVIADHVAGYRDSRPTEVRFTEGSSGGDHITSWRRTFAFTPGKRSARDWNYLTMSSPEDSETTLDSVPGNAGAELYEYRGLFPDTSGAEAAMKARIQTSEAGYEIAEASSFVRTLAPGQRFRPVDKAGDDAVFDGQVVLSIRHEAEDPTYETNGGRPSYANSFTAMPAKTSATPQRGVPRPLVTGSQVAMVAGPAGEEIFTDEWGRVKVWFPWDRRAAKDGSDTCWIRVGQPWAGTSWGHQVIPRVGMEAVLAYEEGDPDRPFVLAVLPDPTNPVPYTLPDNKTRMVVRSKSYKSSGNNEMTFEDATGAENQFFHASKDQTDNVVNNRTKSVGANEANAIGQNQSTTVGQNATTEVGQSMNVSVGGTGAGAGAMMAPLLGMAGTTAGMLGQALQVAGGAGSGAAGAVSGALSAGASGLGGLMGSAAGMVAPIAGAAVGVLSGAGQQAQGNVVSPSNTLSDAGTALAGSGASLGSAVGGLFGGLPGMLNVSVATVRTDSVGVAHALQVGVSQAVNIGQTKMETVGQAHTHTVGKQMTTTVGKLKQINVGDTFQINVGNLLQIVVGNSTLTMDKEGNVTITGSKKLVDFSGPVTILGDLVHINPFKR